MSRLRLSGRGRIDGIEMSYDGFLVSGWLSFEVEAEGERESHYEGMPQTIIDSNRRWEVTEATLFVESPGGTDSLPLAPWKDLPAAIRVLIEARYVDPEASEMELEP